MYTVISFYRYTELEPEELLPHLKEYCVQQNILGRILLGKEGINGAVCGNEEDIRLFQQWLLTHFPQLTFRKQSCEKNVYHKLVVKVRKEICAFGRDVDVRNHAEYVTPEELEQKYSEYLVVDARNEYEYEMGRFKGAVKLPIQNFREFAETAPSLLPKGKKIILYCTGGIRCEKASAYLKEQGFPQVYHLQGGIINYLNSTTQKQWEGGLFVFDDRLVAETGKPVTVCVHCHTPCEKYVNCHNLDCDALTIICESCQEEFLWSCSPACRDAKKRRERKIHHTVLGVVENYYSRNGVALVRVQKKISKNSPVIIAGKTTPQFSQMITALRNEQGEEIEDAKEELVTFPVQQKVRVHDVVLAW